MIKTDIVAYVSSYALEGELIVPSAVLTSTPQEEEINLAYTPNFQLKLMDKNSYVVDDAWMSFSYSDTNYTAYMNVVNRTQDGIVTLQYNNGLTSEEIPTPEPPQPEPASPYFTSPADGDTITGTYDGVEQLQFEYPLSILYSDGTEVPYDTVVNYTQCTTGGWSIGYHTDGEAGAEYITDVYIYTLGGVGTATLEFSDPATGETCTASFDYDISIPVPEPESITMTLQSNNWTYDTSNDKPNQYQVTVVDNNGNDVTGECTFYTDADDMFGNDPSDPGSYNYTSQGINVTANGDGTTFYLSWVGCAMGGVNSGTLTARYVYTDGNGAETEMTDSTTFSMDCNGAYGAE